MKKAYILAGTAILFWGTYSALGSILMDEISIAEVLFYSGVFASVFLFLYAAVTGKISDIRKITPRVFAELLLLGLAGVVGYNLFYYWGASMLQTQQASVTLYLWPIANIVFSTWLSHTKLSARQIIAVLISFLGVMVVATQGDFRNLLNINYTGFGLVALGAMSYGIFSAMNRIIRIDKSVAMMIYYLELAIAGAVFVTVSSGWNPISLSAIAGTAWNGIFVFAIGYTAWAMAMDIGDPVVLSNFAYLTPFCSLIFIFLLLHEPISLASFAGLFLILGGVLFQMSAKKK